MMDLTNHPYALPDNLEPIKEVDPLDFLKEVIRNLDLPLSVRSNHSLKTAGMTDYVCTRRAAPADIPSRRA